MLLALQTDKLVSKISKKLQIGMTKPWLEISKNKKLSHVPPPLSLNERRNNKTSFVNIIISSLRQHLYSSVQGPML